jgi:hypothetical protein
LEHSDEAEHVARRGWEWIRDHFLMPRLLRDELQLLGSLTKGNSGDGGPPA